MPTRTATTAVLPETTSFGWQLANILAIASPYLVAAALFLFLWMTSAPVPASAPIAASAPPPPVGGPSVMTEAPPPGSLSSPATSDAGKPSGTHPAPAAARSTALHNAGGPSPGNSSSPPPTLEPVAVDPAIAGTMKLSGDPPAYPAVARAANISGTVVLALTVGASGAVQDVQAISGPPLLEAGAVAAVRSWRYRPWLIQGHPVPFTTQLSVNFKIDTAPPTR
jgi:protein TonB